MKIVLATNVFISGVFFTGPPYQILKAWRDGKFEILISKEILEEYKRVGESLSIQFPQVTLTPILKFFAIRAELIEAQPLSASVCEDPDDDKFFACAIAGKSKLIISGDKHLLRISGYQGIKVLKPKEFINQYLTV